MLFKVISYGLIIDMNSYLRSNWSFLDFLIIIFSILDLAFSNLNL